MDRTAAERAGATSNGAPTWRSRIESVTDWFAFPLRTSHYVELVNPLWASHSLQAKVVEVWDETKDSRTLTLKPGVNWRGHRAGQHMRVGVAVGGMNFTRTYTISSPPGRDDDIVTITVKSLAGGRVSHHLVRNTKVGSPDNDINALFNVGYAYRLDPKIVLGVGLFMQGGSCYQYKNLTTAFGTRDEYSAIFGVTKLAFGAAYQVNDALSVGANIGIAYSQARQKVFPDTSTAEFSGLRFDGGKGVSANGRVGLLWKPTPELRIGVSYMTPTTLKLEDATLTVNQEAQDLGRVRYRKAELKGLHLAREAGAGIAYRFQPDWLLAVEINWLDWSDALEGTTLTASRPNNDSAAPTLRLVSPLDHRDQVVYSVGLAHDINEKFQLLMGWNHTRSAIPPETLSPGFNLTTENEVDLGVIYRISPKWDVGAVVQYQFDNNVRYTNPNQPFGPDAKEYYSLVGIDLAITGRW